MNRNLRALAAIAARPTRRIVGLMSGTSLDGLDIALCRVTGSGSATTVALEAFRTVPYDDATRSGIRAVFARRQVDLEDLCLLHAHLAGQHAALVLASLSEWGVPQHDVDLLASHGQTVFHAPRRLHRRTGIGNATLQLGDGDHLAVRTGIITISDFRQKHVAAGGEGAPLAAYGDALLFTHATQERLLLNIGGIANFTRLPAGGDTAGIVCTDTGPGNTLLDAWVRHVHPDATCDRDGVLARAGRVHDALLDALKAHPFHAQPLPRTTGPEEFHLHGVHAAQDASGTRDLADADVAATLTRYTAETIADAVRTLPPPATPLHVYASGGGTHNPVLMDHLRTVLPDAHFHDAAALGIPADAKEAVLFAVLANECVAGEPLPLGGADGGIPAVTLGKVSFPW